MLTQLCSLNDVVGTTVDEDRSCLWFVAADGSLGAAALDGSVDLHQTLAAAPGSIALAGAHLLVSHRDGTMTKLDADAPGGSTDTLTTTSHRLDQVAVTATGRTALVVSGALAHRALMRVEVGSGHTTSRSVPHLVAVARGSTTVYVGLNRPGHGGRIARYRAGRTTMISTRLPAIGRLGVADQGRLVLATHPRSHRLSAFRPGTGQLQTVDTSSLPGTLVEAHGLDDGRIAIVTTEAVTLVDSLGDLTDRPGIDPPDAPLFVGSWVRLDVALGGSGLTMGEVHLEVPDGPEAGFVSMTRENGVGDPVPLLVAGGSVGEFKVQLLETATGDLLDEATFEVTDHWGDSDTGPSCFFSEASEGFSGEGGDGWGSGSSGHPQNFDLPPHVGEWRALVLMVDTSSGRWPTAAAALDADRTSILEHVTDGAPYNGKKRSARKYYEEISRYAAASGGTAAQGLTVPVHNATAYGPVHLPKAWAEYFEHDKKSDGTFKDQWTSKPTTLQTIITQSITDGITTTADWSAVEVVVVVPFSPDATGAAPARFVWPHAQHPQQFLCGRKSSKDKRNLAWVYVPLDFSAHDTFNRQMHTTLSHELGHTLGLPDLYSVDGDNFSTAVKARVTGGWDMMAGSQDTLPHYSISNKMRMGWIPETQLKLFDFRGSHPAADPVTLHAAELGKPPAGQFKAVEIRLGDGWNYYVEYRASQPGQISDDLGNDRRVLITDVTSDSFKTPESRPAILLVEKDDDGDGPVLGPGEDLHETDPGTGLDMVVEVVSTDADSATLQISYGSNGKPEPGIRPWNGAPTWQSPDIEIRNDKATADPAHWFNTPWLGHDNTIRASVRNNGSLLARGVVVDFFVTDYTTGDGPWLRLGSTTLDVDPGDTVAFDHAWNPPADGGRHYCVIVRIRLYQDPDNPAVIDQNIYNQEARSNYTSFVSASASPSTRVGAEVLLANPYDVPTLVLAHVAHTHSQHRLFLEHQYLRVDGSAQRPVQIWDEALLGTPEWAAVSSGSEEEPTYLWGTPNQVSVTGWARRPWEGDCGATTLTGGVGIQVGAGRATGIGLEKFGDGYFYGQVAYVDNHAGVSRGMVLIELSDGHRTETLTVDVNTHGSFGTEFSDPFGGDLRWGVAHYLGAYGAAPCTSERFVPQ